MNPTVSVIMPVHNEADFLKRSLGAVYRQDYPSACMEVIVVDGDSTDNTAQIAKRMASEYPAVKTRVLHNPGRTVPKGMNLALADARGDVVVRVDGHTIIARDYVRQCVHSLQQSGADNVGGRMRPMGRSYFGKAVALATTSRFGIGGSRFHYSDREEFVDTVYLGAWPRKVFTRVGSFDEEQMRNQDDEFNYRLRSAGGRILLSPSIRSRYFNRCSPRSLARQYFQYGYWKVRVMQKHPAQMKPRHFVPALLMVTVAVSLCAVPFSPTAAWVFAICTAMYLLANAAASLLTVQRGPWWVVAVLPLAFAILHLAYGSGFLVGLVRFSNRWKDRARGVASPSETSG